MARTTKKVLVLLEGIELSTSPLPKQGSGFRAAVYRGKSSSSVRMFMNVPGSFRGRCARSSWLPLHAPASIAEDARSDRPAWLDRAHDWGMMRVRGPGC